MNRGAWHQFGDRSQRLALEQLQNGSGVGVIISPRDLSREKAITYSQHYLAENAQVLLDHQFYIPTYSNKKLESYPISSQRTSISALNAITDHDLAVFAASLEADNRQLGTTAVIAPAVVYEAGRSDIDGLNTKLFRTSKSIGDAIGIPTYATVFLGRSITASENLISRALSSATALNADGWYFGFEFEPERIPSNSDSIERFLNAGLTLACTGNPILHAYAGPLSVLSFCFGATGAAVGHSQNLWHFHRDRWQPDSGQGGGGDAPPRFFSRSLWGTIVYPDETRRLPQGLRLRILTQSAFSQQTATNLQWSRWDANKHFVYIISSEISRIVAGCVTPRESIAYVQSLLQNSINLYGEIERTGLTLMDKAFSYQANWLSAINQFLVNKSDDFDFLELL